MKEKSIRVKYFAKYRELLGIGEERLSTRCETVGGLLEEISKRHPELVSHKDFLISRNQNYADPDSILADGDEIGILPPVSGG